MRIKLRGIKEKKMITSFLYKRKCFVESFVCVYSQGIKNLFLYFYILHGPLIGKFFLFICDHPFLHSSQRNVSFLYSTKKKLSSLYLSKHTSSLSMQRLYINIYFSFFSPTGQGKYVLQKEGAIL